MIRHIGWLVERCRTGLLERIFAEAWLKENNLDKRHGINFGLGTLQELFMKAAPKGAWWARHGGAKIVINKRDAFVAATVIQWLGTNCGFSFLRECLAKAGYSIVSTNEARDRYYSRHTQTGYVVVLPSAWHNFAQRHCVFFSRDRAEIVEYEVDSVAFRSRDERREELRRALIERGRRAKGYYGRDPEDQGPVKLLVHRPIPHRILDSTRGQ